MMDTMPDQPLIAIDVVPVAFSASDGLRIGTATRMFDPFAGQQALPGVLLGTGESLSAAAYRALLTKSGIANADVLHLAQLGAFDQPNRDPRSAAISIAFVAVVAPGAGEKTEWTSNEIRTIGLPFDHDSIIDTAREHLRTRLWSDTAMTAALTGAMFNTPDAGKLTEHLTGEPVDKGNFRRTLLGDPRIALMNESYIQGRGRPRALWRWLE
jgi:8-oxo-dGTP diphosphatase